MQTTEGPLPVEVAAENYKSELYERLRCPLGWRKDIFALLREEYDRFLWKWTKDNFGIQDMWEYAKLVEVTDQYLRDKGSQAFAAWFYKKVDKDLNGIYKKLIPLEYEEWEKESLDSAFGPTRSLIGIWEAAQHEAREE